MERKSNIVAVVDVGDAKIVCLIAKTSPTGEINIIGVGHQSSEGYKAGAITDMKALRASIIATIYAAEQMASVNVNTVMVNISSALARSYTSRAQIILGGRQVVQSDVRRLINLSLDKVDHTKEELLHFSALSYDVDDFKNIQNPEFMFANKLKVETSIMTAPKSILVNMASCFAGCHIQIGEFILSSYASAIACLQKEELDSGAVIIDIGGGATNIALFDNGHLVFSHTIGLGGRNITRDIATFFSINLDEAERIKVVYGSAVALKSDEDKTAPVKQFSDDQQQEPNSISNLLLNQVIAARVEEIFEKVHNVLERNGFKNFTKRSIILTGGSAQLSSIDEVASQVFGCKVRVGLPRISNLENKLTRDPSFATAIGMVKYYFMNEYHKHKSNTKHSGLLGKIITWLKHNF